MRRLRHPLRYVRTRRGWKRVRFRPGKPTPQPTRPELLPSDPLIPSRDDAATALPDEPARPADARGGGSAGRHRGLPDVPDRDPFGKAACKLTIPR
jgi:hypothetical protein